jgi:hypothetical protein
MKTLQVGKDYQQRQLLMYRTHVLNINEIATQDDIPLPKAPPMVLTLNKIHHIAHFYFHDVVFPCHSFTHTSTRTHSFVSSVPSL